MIKGVGTDICQIARISQVLVKQGARFAQRVLTPKEYDRDFNRLDERRAGILLAKRFAVKEAIAKALGTGIGQQLSFQDIQIDHDPLGKPIAVFSETAKSTFSDPEVHISLSDELDYVVAFAVWQGR